MTQYVNFYNYLFSASTPEELKKRYIELIKTNHPDKGGSVETCQEIIHLEICGTWLWVTGDTWNYRAELKSQGLKWASNKKAWFFHEYEWTRKNRHSMSMEEIRENHGNEKIKEVKRQRIA